MGRPVRALVGRGHLRYGHSSGSWFMLVGFRALAINAVPTAALLCSLLVRKTPVTSDKAHTLSNPDVLRGTPCMTGDYRNLSEEKNSTKINDTSGGQALFDTDERKSNASSLAVVLLVEATTLLVLMTDEKTLRKKKIGTKRKGPSAPPVPDNGNDLSLATNTTETAPATGDGPTGPRRRLQKWNNDVSTAVIDRVSRRVGEARDGGARAVQTLAARSLVLGREGGVWLRRR